MYVFLLNLAVWWREEGLGEEELEERGGRRWGDWEVRTEEEFDS